MNVGPVETVPPLALGLGAAGLLPFAAGTAGLWWLDPLDAGQLVGPLVGYAAVILSFMGAVHWGLAMSLPSTRGEAGRNRVWFIVSVLPALCGWTALLLSPLPGLLLLVFGFGSVFWLDLLSIRAGIAPVWYVRLRAPLSVIVGSLLLFSAGALALRTV